MFLRDGCVGYLCALGAIRTPRCARGWLGQMALIGRFRPRRGLPDCPGDDRNGWIFGWRGSATASAQVADERTNHYGGAQ